jgi:outer membrane protein OmpA-like peptidoglycan-associated protein
LPAPEIVIIGHTDRLGSVARNDELSILRARKVRDAFLAIGVPLEMIKTEGRGEREPAVPTADDVPEPRNRRAEIKIR